MDKNLLDLKSTGLKISLCKIFVQYLIILGDSLIDLGASGSNQSNQNLPTLTFDPLEEKFSQFHNQFKSTDSSPAKINARQTISSDASSVYNRNSQSFIWVDSGFEPISLEY